MGVLLCICLLFFLFFQGCHQATPSSENEDQFKKYANSNTVVNSSTSIAQPEAKQPDTLVNVAF